MIDWFDVFVGLALLTIMIGVVWGAIYLATYKEKEEQ